MAEGKEYIARETADGSLNISEDVIGIIAHEAMREVEGFGGVSNTLGKDIAELIGKKSAFRGITVSARDEGLTIDAFVSVKYGYAVTKVAAGIQEAIAKAVSDMTGVEVKAVNVHVGGIAFEKEKQ